MNKKAIFGTVGAAAGVLTAGAVHRANQFKTEPPEPEPFPEENINFGRLTGALTHAIQIPTISHEDETETDWNQFEKYQNLMRETFPLTFSTLEVTPVSKASLLLYWKGTDESLDPIGFCAHQDVVPVAEGTEDDWDYPPFSGYNDGTFIYGRGAIDMKNHLLSLLESVESLLEEGYQPKRGIYLMFGHNEEIVSGKSNGAEAIAAELEKRGAHLDSIVDEGGAIFVAKVPHLLDANLAAIGIAEKGYADIRVTVSGKGGHSSTPPAHSTLGILAEKVVNLEKHPFKGSMPDYLPELFKAIGSRMTLPGRIVTSNLDLLKPLLVPVMIKIPAAAGLVSSTQCVTMAEGAPAGNIVPEKASVVINCRMMQGTTILDVMDHIEKYMGGENTTIELVKGKEASIVSPTDSRAFRTLAKLAVLNKNTNIVAPYLDMGGTDCFHYENVCSNIYRFAPFTYTAELIGCEHGTNERMPLDEFEKGTKFFKHYMRVMTEE